MDQQLPGSSPGVLPPSPLLAAALLQQNSTALDFGLEFWDPKISSSYRWVLWVQTVMEPIIIILGILGNTLATITLMTRQLRATSCCLYLAAKCVGDGVFLAALFVVWLYRVDAPVINNNGICQITVFLTYACSYASVWLIVLVSHENYVRIARPDKVKICCTPRRAITNICIVFFSAGVIYNFHLWTTQVMVDDFGEMLCMALKSYHELLATINVLDLVLTLILPVLLVAGLMLFTLVAVVQAVKRKNRLHDSLIGNNRSHNERFQTVEVKVAKFLTIVSLTLLVLHSPSHVIRLKLLIASTARSTHVSEVDPTLQRAFEVMYYLNFSANFCIYATFGENFRRTFLRVFSFRHMYSFYKSRRMKRLSPEASPHQSDSSMHMELTVVNDAFEDTSFVEDDSVECSKECSRESSSEHFIYAKEFSANGAPPNVALL